MANPLDTIPVPPEIFVIWGGMGLVRARNEALDCRVYALAAYALLNANINQIANRIAMKREAVEPKPKPVSPARRIRRPKQQNWVNGWR